MNKSESKYFNTAIKMDNAFMELLEEKDFEYISVKEICKRAGVNRSTFYLHYETIGDLLEEAVRYMNEKFLEYYGNKEQHIANRIKTAELKELYLITPKFLIPYLEYIKKHRKIFLTAIKRSNSLGLSNTYNNMFTYIFNPIMDKFSISEKEKKYLSAFYINGILAVIKTWISNNCEEDIDFIVKVICNRIHVKEK